MSWVRSVVICAAVLLTAALGSQLRPPAPAQVPPTFRSSVDIVRLDVSVLDSDRRPVRGLTEGDFIVFEDGVEQPVAVFQPIEIPERPIEESSWAHDISPDVATNDPPKGRLWVLVLDDATTRPDPWALEAAKEIARGIVAKIDPSDRVAVIFVRDNRHAQDFTNDRPRLLTAINSLTLGFMGGGNTGRGNLGDAYFQTSSIRTLREAVAYLADVPDQRRVLIYVGFGIGVDFFQAPVRVGPNGGGGGQDSERVRLDETKRLIQDAQSAGVSVYSYNACGLGSRNCSNGSESLYVVSGNTGGHAVVATNDFRSGTNRMFQENGSYYLIGYRSTSREASGFRRTEVKVRRPGVDIHTRTGYQTDRGVARQQAQTQRLSPATAAVAGMLPTSDLALRVTAAPFAQMGGKESAIAVALGIRLSERQSVASGVETFVVETRAFTPEGTPIRSSSQTVRAILEPKVDGTSAVEVLSRLDLKPGRYSLRFGVQAQTLGLAGGVYLDVDVPDFAVAPLSTSGIALDTESGSFRVGTALAGLLPFAPSSERTFLPNQRVVAFLRLYQGGKAPLESVTLNSRVLDARGRATPGQELRTIGVDQFGADRSSSLLWPIPIGGLPPGPYLLTLEASRGATVVKRDLPFRMGPLR